MAVAGKNSAEEAQEREEKAQLKRAFQAQKERLRKRQHGDDEDESSGDERESKRYRQDDNEAMETNVEEEDLFPTSMDWNETGFGAIIEDEDEDEDEVQEEDKDGEYDSDEEPGIQPEDEPDLEYVSLLPGYEPALDYRVILRNESKGLIVEYERQMRELGLRQWVNDFGFLNEHPDYDAVHDSYYNALVFPEASVMGLHGDVDWFNNGIALGQGGFGCCVLWYRRNRTGEIVDTVVTKDQYDPDGQMDILQEARMMERTNRLQSDFIVQMRSYSRLMIHRVHRLYLEHCKHGDLHQLKRQYRETQNQIHLRGLPECYLWKVFEGLALAVRALQVGPPNDQNWRPILHYDLKPNNVFLGNPLEQITPHARYPAAKIGDFGLSKLFLGYNWDSVKGCGTTGFIPPEIIQGSTQQVAPPANIWGIGQIMHSLAVHGQRRGLSEEQKQQRAATFYSNELEELVAKCLLVDIYERPTVEELLTEITAAKTVAFQAARTAEAIRVDEDFEDEDPDKLWFEEADIRNNVNDAYHLWWIPGPELLVQDWVNPVTGNERWVSGNILNGIESQLSDRVQWYHLQ